MAFIIAHYEILPVQYRRAATPAYTFVLGMAVDVLSCKPTSRDMKLESCNQSIHRQQL